MDTVSAPTSVADRAEALERQLSDELDAMVVPVRATLYLSGERDARRGPEVVSAARQDARSADAARFLELQMGPAISRAITNGTKPRASSR